MSNFDIENFSEEVFQEYNFWKIAKTEAFPGEIMKRDATTISSKLFAGFVGVVDKFSQKSIESEKIKKKFVENENYATSIISQPENKRVICEALDELKTNEIITEEKYVKKLTRALCGKVLNEEIPIPFSKQLFAAIAYKIYEEGLEKFCVEFNNG